MDSRYMVKQYIGKLQISSGQFQVFMTGNPKWLLFDPLHNGFSTCMQFPVEKKRLRRDWRKFLVV